MKTAIFYIMSFFALLAAIKGLIYCVTACLVIDTLLVMRIVYVDEDIDFEWSKFWRVVSKWWFYVITILLFFLFDKYILENNLFGINLFLSKAITTCWVFQESKSINNKWCQLGNKSIFGSIKEFVDDLKCIKEQYNQLKK